MWWPPPLRTEFKRIPSPSAQLNEAQCLKGAELPPWTCSVADIIIFIMRFYVAPDSSGEEPAELLKGALRSWGARLLRAARPPAGLTGIACPGRGSAPAPQAQHISMHPGCPRSSL